MERVTDHPTANEQLLYFTSPSITADGATLVFLSDRGGEPNVFARDLGSGHETQVTDNTAGVLRSYVYFDGREGEGLGKASISLDPRRGLVYYLQGNDIRVADLSGHRRRLATIAEGLMTGFTHVSTDGRWFCLPTIDRAAFGEHRGGYTPTIDERVRERGLASHLRIFDTASGEEVAREPVPEAWVTHVQFNPADPTLLMYNHEWCSETGWRRMWLWDGEAHRPLRSLEAGRIADDWICHEVWSQDGAHVIYHGGFGAEGVGGTFVGRITPASGATVEVPLPEHHRGYGHFITGPADRLVTDGYYRASDDPPGNHGRWICLVDVDWDDRRTDWTPLERHGSSWTSQDAHPHPVFSPDGAWVYLTSDFEGRRAVYRINTGTTA